MPLPRPAIGLVIHYEYLWRHEINRGEERGQKRRPCLIVALPEEVGSQQVVVAPITHAHPRSIDASVEIPRRVKDHLGLDQQRSWLILDDLNVFDWPGIDIHPVPNRPPGTFDYGFVPPRLFSIIRERIEALGSIPGATRRVE